MYARQVRKFKVAESLIGFGFRKISKISSVDEKSPKGHTYVIEARTEKSYGKNPQVCLCSRRQHNHTVNQYQLRLYLKLASQLSHTIISSIILRKASNKMFRALAILASIVGGECNALTASWIPFSLQHQNLNYCNDNISSVALQNHQTQNDSSHRKSPT